MKQLFFLLCFVITAARSVAQAHAIDYFINRALENSPLLKEYRDQAASLSLDSQLIRAALRPQLNGVSTNSYAPVIAGIGYDNAITNGAQVSAMLVASKSFVSNKSIASRVKDLQLQSLVAGNSAKLSEKDIQKLVTDQYITTYGGQLQVNFNERINGLLRKEDSLLKRLTQANVYKQADYLSFVVTLQQQLLNTSQLRIQYALDYATLNYVAGITDTTMQPLPDPELSLTEPGDFTNSVFARQFVLDSLKLINDRTVVDINYRPSITAYADAGYNSSLAYKPYRNFGASAGLSLSIPIYDGKQKKLQYSKISIQERTRQNKKQYYLQQHEQQVLQLQQQLHATDELLSQVDKQIKYTETLITVNEKLLSTGDIRLTDFILSLSNYFTARNLVTQNYISRLKIVNQLNYWSQ